MTQRIHLSGDATLDLERGYLLRAGRAVHLRRQTYDVLRFLVLHRGRVVDKERFIDEIWQGRAVTDGSLAKCVEELREAVGPEAAVLIRTVRGRGYLLDEPNGDAPSTSAPLPTVGDTTDRDAPAVSAGAPVTLAWPRGRYRTVALVVASLTLLSAAAAFVPGDAGREGAAPTVTSLAVLPIINATGDASIDYVASGLTAGVIERLSRLGGLKVISHMAVGRYAGHASNTQAVGRELGVGAVLIGRLTKRQSGMVLALELVDTRDSRHLWGRRYDRESTSIAALERTVPIELAEDLRLVVSPSSRRQLTRTHTDSAEAHQLYLKGRYAWEKWTTQGSKEAVAYFDEAIRRDPEYALAYAGLADAYLFGMESGAGLPRPEARRRGMAAATRALALDPQLAEARVAVASSLLLNWDFAGAERELRRAIELKPNYPEGHHLYSHLLLILGRYDDSLRESRLFLELDPVSESPIGHLAWHHLWARQYDDAIAWSLKDRQLYPDAPQPQLFDAYYQKGMYREAAEEFLREHARTLTPAAVADLRSAYTRSGMNGLFRTRIAQLESVPDAERADVDIAAFYARLGEPEAAFAHLELAFVKHSEGLASLKSDVRFDRVREDPRFALLLSRIGVPE